jgi:enamine deaminase RidA (YjgF/YER057c/UK114 family)
VSADAGPLLTPAFSATPEFVLTECPRPGEPLGDVFLRIAATLAVREAQLVHVMVYGAMAAQVSVLRAMHEAFGETNWPLTWVECASCEGAALAGVQALVVSNRAVTRVRFDGRVVASVYEDGGARHCLLGGLGPRSIMVRTAIQAEETFAKLAQVLDLAGFEVADVVRTWFYNEDILAWYADFNRVRSALYKGVQWRTGSLPASTGIGARNLAGAALSLGAWAVRPISPGAKAIEVASPLQCPAPAYGSSFARAMEINSGGWRRLLVSGTASIHPGGRTAWVDDAPKQVDLTMEVIAAILQSRGMDFKSVTRATAYYRRPEYKGCFDAWLAARDLHQMPVVHTHSVVCRDDLLFELELDAAAPA